MSKLRIGVLRGGPSDKYDVSLNTGLEILNALPEDRFVPIDVWISRGGDWHVRGEALHPEKILRQVDVTVNAMHGTYGEDGQVQAYLDLLGAPYTGSGSFASAQCMDKRKAKRVFESAGIRTPTYTVVPAGYSFAEEARAIAEHFDLPVVVKPLASGGSSLGATLARTEYEIADGLRTALCESCSNAAIVEEYIQGREATCGVIEHFRGEELYALPPVEIVPPPGRSFFDYEVKYNGASQEICPARFPLRLQRRIEEISREVCRLLNVRHYARVDMIVPEDGEPYVLEVNTLPGLNSETLFPKGLKAVGSSLPAFLEHVIGLAKK